MPQHAEIRPHRLCPQSRLEVPRRLVQRLVGQPLERGDIPEPVHRVLLRCLQVDPQKRFPSAAALARVGATAVWSGDVRTVDMLAPSDE